MDGIKFIEYFIENSQNLLEVLVHKIDWDERMKARKTASFGVAYNYSQIEYPNQKFIPEIEVLLDKIENELAIRPNNCLVNYYTDGSSRMGFHSDQIDILEENTGVAIISIGQERTLRFRKIDNEEEKIDFNLNSGSLIYMNQEVQKNWQHAIPKSKTENGRISLTFRKIKNKT